MAAAAALAVAVSGLGTGVPATAATPRAGTTFHVTSTSMCGGAGTLEQAVKDANANPGADTIVFDTPDMQVDVSTCVQRVPGFDYGLNATESVDIQANGATFNGNQQWVNVAGRVNDPNMCPQSQGSNAYWLQISTGFMLVGTWGQPSVAVTVTVNNAHFNGLPSLVETTGDASFTMVDSTASQTIDFLGSCDRPAIAALDGGEIRLVDSRIERSVLPGRDGQVSALISTNSAAVVLDRAFLGGNLDGAAVRTATGPVTIVSSTLGDSGGLWLGADSQIVNTAFFSSGDRPTDRVVTVGGTTTVKASTFYWLNPTCPTCDPAGPPGLGFRTAPGAKFSLRTSAIGANLFADAFGPPYSGPLLPDRAANVDTDSLTWIQPTHNQDAAALHALVPNAKTDPPGLLALANPYNTYYVDAITPLLGAPGTPGVLIDAVPDATCPGGANALQDPVNGGCIATDVLGNSRVDGNGRRNIGAVQSSYAPHLTVTGSGDGVVDLAWNRPIDPPSGSITGYDIGYRPAGSGGAFAHVYPSGAGTLSQQITGLTNGTQYEFIVRAVNASGPGPDSNTVVATPLGPIATPVVTATPGNGKVTLTWPVPDSGGHPGLTYAVAYRPQGSTIWLPGPGRLTSPTATVTPLAGGVTYEFAVVATAADSAASATGTASATPAGDIPPPPTLTVSGATKRTLTATWTKQVEPSSGPVTGYVLYVAAPGQPYSRFPVSGANTLTLTLAGLTPDTPYRMYVVGVNRIGEGPPSAVVTGRTLPDAHLDYPLGRGQTGVAISPLLPHTQDVTEPRSFTIIAGELPVGLSLERRTGVISGTPTKAGRTVVTVEVRGDNGGVATSDVTIVITDAPVAPHLSYPTGRGEVGKQLDPLLPHVAGLTGDLSYALAKGSLPPGIHLDHLTGTVSGTPHRHGRYRFTVEVNGSEGTARARVTITVRKAPRPPVPVRQPQRPAKARYGPPDRIAAPGTTVITPAGAVTNAGQRIRTTVTCTPLLRVAPTGDRTWCRVVRGAGTRVTVTTPDTGAVRVVVVQSAPRTTGYRAYRDVVVYVDGRRA